MIIIIIIIIAIVIIIIMNIFEWPCFSVKGIQCDLLRYYWSPVSIFYHSNGQISNKAEN